MASATSSSSSSATAAAPEMSQQARVAKNFVAGGVAGMCARTVIAPIERVKIIYQTRSQLPGGAPQGWSTILRQVVDEAGGFGPKGIAAFWKGNSVAIIRVFPYLGVQLASNEYYKRMVGTFSQNTFHLSSEVRSFLAGGGAGMTAVLTTYPLDLARARMALLMEQGVVQRPTFYGTLSHVVRTEGGFLALYSGAGISMTGAALYCGLKFASYDACKSICKKYLLPDPDGPPSALHRAMSGALAGTVGQTVVYPFDVLRRRLQTGGAEAKAKYPNTIVGFWRLYKDEGLVRGLYRGCSLNYLKTIPNTTVYLALFDFLKELA